MLKLLQEYFDLYDYHFGDVIKQASFKNDEDLVRFYETELKNNSLAIRYNNIIVNSFEYKIFKFVEDVEYFWKQKKVELQEHLLKNEGYRIQVPIREHMDDLVPYVKKLAIYFDTVVLLECFHPLDGVDIDINYLRNYVVHNFRFASKIYSLKPIILSGKDDAFVTIIQSNEEVDDQKVQLYATNFLNKMFNEKFDAGLLSKIMSNDSNKKAKKILNKAKKNKSFLATLSCFDSSPRYRFATDPKTQKTIRVVGYLKDLSPSNFLRAFIVQIFNDFDSIGEYEILAQKLGNDSAIGLRRWESYIGYLETQARHSFTEKSIGKEDLVPIALQKPNLNFLGEISFDELIKLRQTKQPPASSRWV